MHPDRTKIAETCRFLVARAAAARRAGSLRNAAYFLSWASAMRRSQLQTNHGGTTR